MTRTKPAEQRRADLLAAAQALFLAKGIAATPLEDITHQAGVSKGLFYLYFHSKEDLVLSLQDQFSRQLAEHVAAAADIPAGWPAKLDACVQASFERYRDLHDLHEVLFHHAAHPGPLHQASPTPAPRTRPATRTKPPVTADEHEQPHARLTQVIRDLLAAGTAAGAFDVADPETTAALCYASMHAFDRGFRDPGDPGGPGGPGGPDGPDGPGGPDGLDDARLLRATRQLFRRAAGVTGG